MYTFKRIVFAGQWLLTGDMCSQLQYKALRHLFLASTDEEIQEIS